MESPSVLAKTLANSAVAGARACLPFLTDEERLALFASLTEGYCKVCGREEDAIFCQCWNDE